MRNPELVVRSGEGYLASARTRPTGDAAAQTMAFALTTNLRYQGIGVAARLDKAADAGGSRALRVKVNTGDLRWVANTSASASTASSTSMMGEIATVSVVSANVSRDGKVMDYKVETMHARAAAEATQNNKAELCARAPLFLDSAEEDG